MAFDLKNYITVKERKKSFYIDHPDGVIIPAPLTSVSEMFNAGAFFECRIWKDRKTYDADRGPDTVGHSLSLMGGKGADSTSWTENCEESAIGRALDNMGYIGDRLACSREEIIQAQNNREAMAEKNAVPVTTEELEGIKSELVDVFDEPGFEDLAYLSRVGFEFLVDLMASRVDNDFVNPNTNQTLDRDEAVILIQKVIDKARKSVDINL